MKTTLIWVKSIYLPTILEKSNQIFVATRLYVVLSTIHIESLKISYIGFDANTLIRVILAYVYAYCVFYR